MFKSVSSGDKTIIKNAAIGAAKAASILGVPVVLSSINPKSLGEFIPEITKLFPDQEVFARKIPSFDAFEDERNLECCQENREKESGHFRIVDQHVLCIHRSACFERGI